MLAVQQHSPEVLLPQIGRVAQSTDDWQQQLRNVITSRDELLSELGLRTDEVGLAGGACEDFALKVPRSFVQRMRRGDPLDPLLLQVLSTASEMLGTTGYGPDPVGETGATIPHRGIIHKYHGRVLLIVSGGCAVNCRYCFRRHFPYQENQNSREQWRERCSMFALTQALRRSFSAAGTRLLPRMNNCGSWLIR
jgi:L-lysine 2,3-aminomutase